MRKVGMGLIYLYQRIISPLKPPTCRFFPTCSVYGMESFRRHGFLLGGWYTFKRLIKCHPFHPGGFDEVPPKRG